GQQVRELLLELRDALDEQAEVADRYRAGGGAAQDDRRRRAHQARGGQRRRQAPAAAPAYERHELSAEAAVVRLPLLHQVVAEPEQPGVLDGLVVRQQAAEVVLPPGVLRLAPDHPVALRAEARLHP